MRRCCAALTAVFIALIMTGKAPAQPSPETSVGMTGRIERLVLPGSELEAAPNEDRQAPVVVRIVRTYPHGSAFRYDLVYHGLEPGAFDLKKLLRRKDGGSTEDLPSIPIKVTPLLPPGQVQPHALEFSKSPFLGGYLALQIAAGIGWVLGLVGIVYHGFLRSRMRSRRAADAKPPTLADRLRPLIDGAMSGKLDRTQLADLERTLIAFWRLRLNLELAEPALAIDSLRKHEEAGPLLEQLEIWLHRPASASIVDPVQLLRPYRDLPADALEGSLP